MIHWLTIAMYRLQGWLVRETHVFTNANGHVEVTQLVVTRSYQLRTVAVLRK